MKVFRHASRLALREPRRTAAAAAGVAIAVALLTSVILFGAASATTATRRALAEVAVDGQAVLTPGSDAAAVATTLAADPAVIDVLPFELAQFDTAVLSKAGAATQTSRGVVVGIDPDYRTRTGLFNVSQGAPAPGALLIGRDLASNLGATVGDTIELTLPGGRTIQLPVSGLVDTTGADLVLGPTDAAHRAASPNPPANVAVTDRATWESIAKLIPADAVAAPSPDQSPGSGGPVLAQEPAARRELQLRYDRTALPGDPVDAQNWLDTVRRRLERAGAGTFTIADDAAASLAPVASDLAWGRVLFVFLALPGVGLALALSRFAAESGSDANRRHAGLLRARGATARQLVATFAIAAALAGGIGAVLGAVAGLG
ncbi:MAG: ABC transporter permease, partial [Chloroflexota bacterium]|nr:ABC transporter permease [Chloroflexota bacterium]